MNIPYLNQQTAADIDTDLVSLGYSIPQLMELAGLSCATTIWDVTQQSDQFSGINPADVSVLVLIGPGNNGGDGLVLARHLSLWGYHVSLIYPKRKVNTAANSEKHFYELLLDVCLSSGCTLIDDWESYINTVQMALKSTHVASTTAPVPIPSIIIDSIFGFSFKCQSDQSLENNIRDPFLTLVKFLQFLATYQPPTALSSSSYPKSKPFTVSIDIPTGWHVEHGDVLNTGFSPCLLISLTAPKLCAKTYVGGIHALGGRFIPKSIQDQYGLAPLMKLYDGSSQYVILPQQQ